MLKNRKNARKCISYKMKTAQLFNNKIEIKEIPSVESIKSTGKKGAIIKVIGCGLCGSDIVKIKHFTSANNSTIGHEVVGEIVEINSETNFKVGDCVVVAHHVPCFDCIYCKHKNYSMCNNFKKSNIIPGGFSEYIYLSEAHLKNTVFLKPKNLSVVEASFMEPLACCVRACKRADLMQNDNAMVVGLGSIGFLMSQALNSYNIRVIGVDLIQERVNKLADLNIDNVLFENDNITSDKIKQMTNGFGVDCVFMTSGAKSALEFALKSVRNGGKIVVFSSISDDEMGYQNNQIYYRELTVLGSYSPSPIDLKESLSLLENKNVKVEGLSSEYSLDNINQAVLDTINNKIMKAFIKI